MPGAVRSDHKPVLGEGVVPTMLAAKEVSATATATLLLSTSCCLTCELTLFLPRADEGLRQKLRELLGHFEAGLELGVRLISRGGVEVDPQQLLSLPSSSSPSPSRAHDDAERGWSGERIVWATASVTRHKSNYKMRPQFLLLHTRAGT